MNNEPIFNIRIHHDNGNTHLLRRLAADEVEAYLACVGRADPEEPRHTIVDVEVDFNRIAKLESDTEARLEAVWPYAHHGANEVRGVREAIEDARRKAQMGSEQGAEYFCQVAECRCGLRERVEL